MTYCGCFWRQRERRRNKRQSTYRRPKWSEYYEEKSLQLPIENYTCSTRLCFSYFICDNKHTFGKQIPPDLAMLLAFLIETVDWLDKNESRMLNQIQIIVHSTSQYITSCSDGKVVKRLHSHKLLIWQPCGTVLTGWTMIWVWIQRWNEPNLTQLISADTSRDQCMCAICYFQGFVCTTPVFRCLLVRQTYPLLFGILSGVLSLWNSDWLKLLWWLAVRSPLCYM